MATVGFLKISAVQDSNVKQIAQNSNIETKDNDVIETNREWKAFLNGIAEAFANGSIAYDVAKKYVNLSSSVFERRDECAKGYKDGFCNGLNIIHEIYGSRPERWIANMYNKVFGKPGLSKETILSSAENREAQAELIKSQKELIKTQKALIESYNKTLESARNLSKSYNDAIAKAKQLNKSYEEMNCNYNNTTKAE